MHLMMGFVSALFFASMLRLHTWHNTGVQLGSVIGDQASCLCKSICIQKRHFLLSIAGWQGGMKQRGYTCP